MQSENYYELLGVPPNAKTDEIASAFRRRARSEHPDKGGDAENFRKLTHAKNVLTDAAKREEYDASLRNGTTYSEDSTGGAPKPPDQMVQLQISITDAIRGVSRSLRVNRRVACTGCEGSGIRKGANAAQAYGPCPACRGARMTHMGPCGACGMSGRAILNGFACTACGGQKLIHEQANVPFQVPPRSPDGARIRLHGQAGAMPGQCAGDIVICVRVAAEGEFTVLQGNLITDANITLLQAIAGGELELRHPDGTHKRLRFGGGVQHGDVISFPGLGIDHNSSLVLRAIIRIPKLNLSSSADDIARALTEHTNMTNPAPLLASNPDVVERHVILKESEFVERTHSDAETHGDNPHMHAQQNPMMGQQVQCAQN